MKISLEKLIRKETDKLDINISEKIDSIDYSYKEFKLDSLVNIKGKISKTNKGIYLDTDISFTIIDNCSRCLVEVKVPIEYSIKGFLVKENIDEDYFEDEDAFLYDGQEVDFLSIIEQTIDFEIPQKTLCSEDCRGLCQGCGANLNTEICSCDETANNEEDNIDPRFAKLKDLLKND